MAIHFIDNAHETFYLEKLALAEQEGKRIDSYFRSLLYLLGLTEDTRTHFLELFDWDEWGICFEGLSAGWQTGGTIRITRLAFNLWNGCRSDDPESEVPDAEYLPDSIFDCSFLPFFFEAIQLRFSHYISQLV